MKTGESSLLLFILLNNCFVFVFFIILLELIVVLFVCLKAMSEELGYRLDEDRESLVALERTSRQQEAVCDDLRESFGSLITKESFWDVMEKRTKWHAERLGKYCVETEDGCSASEAPSLSPEARKRKAYILLTLSCHLLPSTSSLQLFPVTFLPSILWIQ